MIAIPANKLKAVLLHAAAKDVRFYLNGVFVESSVEHGVILVGTDGNTLFAGKLPDPDIAPLCSLIIPRDVVKQALVGTSATSLLQLDCGGENERPRLGAVTFDPIDGRFPDWRRVVTGTSEPNSLPQYNWAYLDRARAALALWHGKRDCEPTIVRQTASGAAIATAVNETALVCVMPLRAEYVATRLARPQPFIS